MVFRVRGKERVLVQLASVCYTRLENDDTDQIHDETAHQSRSAFGNGLSLATKFRFQVSKAPTKSGPFGFYGRFLAGSQAGKARDC